jgi:hypothetical protein
MSSDEENNIVPMESEAPTLQAVVGIGDAEMNERLA